ncbi:MAG: hypothetical protein L6Q99_11775 [Planctomycetes bacterium]|nr:hypothetical protein [Planctomycetota bacterium]
MSERVLVRLPSWLGDFVACEPTVRALVARFGERITLVAPRRFFELLPAGAATCVAAEDGEPGPAWLGHDVALLFTGSFRSALAAFRARIPRRIGQARDGRMLLLTEAVAPARELGDVPLHVGVAGRFPRWLPRPVSVTASELAARLGVFVRDPRPRLEVSAALVERARARLLALGLAPNARFVLANVGARAESAKAYPPELFARTIELVFERHGLAPVLVCGPGEDAACTEVERALAPRPLVSLSRPAPSLGELAALCALSELVLTADNGPRHVAQAVGARVAVVCGPTDPRHTHAHQERTELVRVRVPCGPCHRELCELVGGERHRCMREVAPERFAEAAERLLRGAEGP